MYNPMGQMNMNNMGQMNMNNMGQMNMNNMGQMNMNNNMNMMPLLFQMCNMNQMLYNQLMQNFNNMQNSQNMQFNNNSGGNNEVRNYTDTGYDPFQGSYQNRINISFELMTGKKFILKAPKNITVYELIDGFFKRVGILNPDLQCKVNFIYNGLALKRLINEQPNNNIIENMGFNHNSKVLVIDFGDVIGG